MLLWMLGQSPVMNLDASGLWGSVRMLDSLLSLVFTIVTLRESLRGFKDARKLPDGVMRRYGMIDAAFWFGLGVAFLLLGAIVTLVLLVAIILVAATYFRIDRAVRIYFHDRERIRQLNKESWVQRQEC